MRIESGPYNGREQPHVSS